MSCCVGGSEAPIGRLSPTAVSTRERSHPPGVVTCKGVVPLPGYDPRPPRRLPLNAPGLSPGTVVCSSPAFATLPPRLTIRPSPPSNHRYQRSTYCRVSLAPAPPWATGGTIGGNNPRFSSTAHDNSSSVTACKDTLLRVAGCCWLLLAPDYESGGRKFESCRAHSVSPFLSS